MASPSTILTLGLAASSGPVEFLLLGFGIGTSPPPPPYVWHRELRIEETVRARAAYKIEVFDNEVFELYGSIDVLSTLAGANLQFIGYDSLGNVAWDSNAVPPTATVQVTDPAACTYDATAGPLPCGVYRWFVIITNTGQVTDPIWGYLTVDKQNAPIPQWKQDALRKGNL